MPATAQPNNMTRWLLPAVIIALMAASAATAQEIQQTTGSVNTQSTWTPPYVGSRPTRPGTSTNCQSLGSGCTSCSYRTTNSRGLLAEDPATAAAAATASPTGTITAAATRVNRHQGRGSSSGGVSYGGTISGSDTINPWTGTSSGGYYSSSSGGSSSGGGSGSGGSWTCNTCSAAGSYKLTRVNGVGTCGCQNRYGAVGSGSRSAAWQRYPSWPTEFICQPCPDGYVPLGPNSNLKPFYDANTVSWGLQIASTVAANKANVRSAQARAARAASSGGVSTASVSAPTPLFSAKQQAAFVALTQKTIKAASMAEGCDSGCGDTPWYPYECVPCPDGYSVDFYGLTCEANVCNDPAICGDIPSSSSSSSGGTSSGGSTSSSSSSSGGSTSSSSSSSGGSTTSSSSSSGGSSSGGGTGTPCVTCTPSQVSDLITAVCGENAQGFFFVKEACTLAESGASVAKFSSIPDMFVDGADGDDVGDCQKTGNMKGQSTTILWTVDDAAAVSCDKSGSFSVTIPPY